MITLSIIQKSQLEEAKRLDAEYFQPEFLDVENKLNNIYTSSLGELSDSVVNFGAYSLCNYINWTDDGVPYVNVENVKEGYLELADIKHVNDKVNEILKKSQVKEGQIILPMAGTIGNAAVAHKVPSKMNSNQATAKITLKNNMSPYFVSAFLNCYYGKSQTRRQILSSVQPNIFLWQIKSFRIPLVSFERQKDIEKIYLNFLNELENSKIFYTQAEDLLLQELGLKDFKPEENLSYIVNFSEVKKANRIDSDYFQPKYHNFFSKLNNLTVKKLSDVVSIKKGFEPGAESYQEEGKLFIRVSSLSKYAIEDKDQKNLSEELYSKLKNNYEPQLNEILLTKDATPGIAYVVKEPIEGIISGGILRLKSKTDTETEYLALCINSIIGKIQAERDAGGSIIKHWKPEQIRSMLIPILNKETQQHIADLVRKSHDARRRSKELLNEAKRKVEEMIEKRSDN